jgi:hypothetical protein
MIISLKKVILVNIASLAYKGFCLLFIPINRMKLQNKNEFLLLFRLLGLLRNLSRYCKQIRLLVL